MKDLILGGGINYLANRLLGTDRKNVAGIDKFISGGGITGEGTGTKSKGKSTLCGIAKTGIMSLIANAILGPIFGPLALTLGKNIVDKRKGLGFLGQGDQSTAPTDPRGTFTAEGMQFENIQDALGSTDINKDINYNTGVITDKTTGKEIGNVYDEVALITDPDPPAYDFDDSSGDSGSSGGSSSASTAGDAPGYSGPSTFRYGGLASLYR